MLFRSGYAEHWFDLPATGNRRHGCRHTVVYITCDMDLRSVNQVRTHKWIRCHLFPVFLFPVASVPYVGITSQLWPHIGEFRMNIDYLASDSPLATADPFEIFQAWMTAATESEINDPNAFALATIGADGMPSVRTVLLKGLDPAEGTDGPREHTARGFVFYTNIESRKGRDLRATGRAAMLFHWKSVRRQIRVEGSISPVSDDEADAYFASRPRGSQIGAWASRQSAVLKDGRTELEARVAEMEARFADTAVPRPAFWSGFRLTPARLEFWQDRQYRLHDRAVFTSNGTGWTVQRLYP